LENQPPTGLIATLLLYLISDSRSIPLAEIIRIWWKS